MATCPLLWFPIYATEMLGDEDFLSWSPAERGCWITLSARCWADGSIPEDIERMARLCGCNAEEMLKHWSSIASKFEKHSTPGRLISKRIEEERSLAIEKAEKLSRRGKAGAAAKWALEKGEMLKHDSSSAKAMLDDATNPTQPLKESTPLTPQGGTGDAATLLPMEPSPKAKRQRKGKYQSEDIAPENAEYLQKVYERIPAEHPTTGEPVHKGPYATAARAFQAIIDAGEASARELMAVGTLYYHAESLGQEWADWANRVWDTRPKAMMHVATLYGPEKRPYRQLLPVARELIAQKEQRLASQNAEMGMAS